MKEASLHSNEVFGGAQQAAISQKLYKTVLTAIIASPSAQEVLLHGSHWTSPAKGFFFTLQEQGDEITNFGFPSKKGLIEVTEIHQKYLWNNLTRSTIRARNKTEVLEVAVERDGTGVIMNGHYFSFRSKEMSDGFELNSKSAMKKTLKFIRSF